MGGEDYKILMDHAQEDFQTVAILYDGRSGSVFVQSLLDNHPQVSVFPATVLIGGGSGISFDDFWDLHQTDDNVELANAFCNAFGTAFDSRQDNTWCRLDALGPDMNEAISVDIESFKRCLCGLLQDSRIDRRTFFLAVHVAYELARGRDPHAMRILVHALHVPDKRVRDFFDDFPDTKILLMTRNPLETHAAVFRHTMRRHEIEHGPEFISRPEVLAYPLVGVRHAFEYPFHILSACDPEQVRAIRLEDLHLESEIVIHNICEWIGIEFDEVLLKSTFDGRLWRGDSTIAPKNGFSKAPPPPTWRDAFFDHDLIWLEFLLRDRLDAYGYEPIHDLDSPTLAAEALDQIAKPMKWEAQVVGQLVEHPISDAYAVLEKMIQQRVITGKPSITGLVNRKLLETFNIKMTHLGALQGIAESVLKRIDLCLRRYERIMRGSVVNFPLLSHGKPSVHQDSQILDIHSSHEEASFPSDSTRQIDQRSLSETLGVLACLCDSEFDQGSSKFPSVPCWGDAGYSVRRQAFNSLVTAHFRLHIPSQSPWNGTSVTSMPLESKAGLVGACTEALNLVNQLDDLSSRLTNRRIPRKLPAVKTMRETADFASRMLEKGGVVQRKYLSLFRWIIEIWRSRARKSNSPHHPEVPGISPNDLAREVADLSERTCVFVQNLLGALNTDLVAVFGVDDVRDVIMRDLLDRIALWKSNVEHLVQSWIPYCLARKGAVELGLEPFIAYLGNGPVQPYDAIDRFDYAYHKVVFETLDNCHPNFEEHFPSPYRELVKEARGWLSGQARC